MRTNVVIDDGLMASAKQLSGCRTKKQTIESGLRLLVKVNSQAAVRKYKGKLGWHGDLESMRRD